MFKKNVYSSPRTFLKFLSFLRFSLALKVLHLVLFECISHVLNGNNVCEIARCRQ